MLYGGQRIASELVIFHHIGPRNSTQVNQALVYFGVKYYPYSSAFSIVPINLCHLAQCFWEHSCCCRISHFFLLLRNYTRLYLYVCVSAAHVCVFIDFWVVFRFGLFWKNRGFFHICLDILSPLCCTSLTSVIRKNVFLEPFWFVL